MPMGAVLEHLEIHRVRAPRLWAQLWLGAGGSDRLVATGQCYGRLLQAGSAGNSGGCG